jgi:hypothetical protein
VLSSWIDGTEQVADYQMWVVLNEIDLAVKRLPQWMKDEDRSGDAVWSMRTTSERPSYSYARITSARGSVTDQGNDGPALLCPTVIPSRLDTPADDQVRKSRNSLEECAW